MKLTIDNREVEIADGSTVLQAAEKLDIAIPTMCFQDDCKPFTSCMICVVKDIDANKFIPACSALARDGMNIATDSDDVNASRQTALELLLSDHIGDCDAPCHRVCPADINIPAMLRSIMNGEIDSAATIIKEATGNDSYPCEACKCPCEKACRRNQHDSGVSIKLLVAFALEHGNSAHDVEQQLKHVFNCGIGRLIEGEMDEFLKNASDKPRIEPPDGNFTMKLAKDESARCLHCDCLKRDNCKLRSFSDDYGARQRQYAGTSRRKFIQIRQHADVIYEPGKCIKCGLCVRITERDKEPLGMTFIGRGFDVKVGVPFDETVEHALLKTAKRCVEACPTAALAFRDC